MYDIYDISLGQMYREVCVNQYVLCVHSSYMLVAKLTHVTHKNPRYMCSRRSRKVVHLCASLEAVRCDHAKDMTQISMYQDRSKIDPNAPSVERGFPHRA